MNLDRITTLLASGLLPSQVATIVGCSPARISQLKQDPAFSLQLEAKLAEQKEVDVEEEAISTKYMAAEHALINQVIEMAPTADMRDVVGALRVVAERQEKMKTRTSVQSPILHQQLTVVSVNLPAHALRPPTVLYNTEREVVSIENRPLAPMSSEAVVGMFARMNMKGDSHEPVPNTPSAEESLAETLPLASSEVREEQSFLAYAGR